MITVISLMNSKWSLLCYEGPAHSYSKSQVKALKQRGRSPQWKEGWNSVNSGWRSSGTSYSKRKSLVIKSMTDGTKFEPRLKRHPAQYRTEKSVRNTYIALLSQTLHWTLLHFGNTSSCTNRRKHFTEAKSGSHYGSKIQKMRITTTPNWCCSEDLNWCQQVDLKLDSEEAKLHCLRVLDIDKGPTQNFVNIY